MFDLARLQMRFFLCFILAAAVHGSVVSIEDFGAVANDKAYSLNNTNAIIAAMKSGRGASVTVVVPANKLFYIVGTNLDHINNATLQIDGQLQATDQFDLWPLSGDSVVDVLNFFECNNIIVTSTVPHSKEYPSLDGFGYAWWWREILQTLKHGRPHLMHFTRCEDIVIENIVLTNSPQWTINLQDVLRVEVHHSEIHTDVALQRALLRNASRLAHLSDFFEGLPWKDWLADLLIDLDIPTFPLNTDGIDISGKDVHVHHMKIVNFDDSVVPKPSNRGSQKAQCTENILIEDIVVTGVGMAIGSVPPNDNHNCVNNVTFRNVHMNYTIKGIYVKTNPGDHGTGIISNIRFENFLIYRPLWWALWIGPQQQHQPGWNWTERKECALDYPFSNHCWSQPRVPIENITLSNVTIQDPLLSPGVIFCNESRWDVPGHASCKGFEFDQVVVKGFTTNFPFGSNYQCQNVESSHAKGSQPSPSCFQMQEIQLEDLTDTRLVSNLRPRIQ